MKQINMSRKTFLGAAAFGAAGVLAGCGSQSTSSDSSSTSTETDKSFESASLDDVKGAGSDVVLVDARPQDCYAGWTDGDNAKGGHIEGAQSFSAKWLTCTYDDSENPNDMTRDEFLDHEAENAGLKDAESVIVYDENGEDAKAVASYLDGIGVSDVKVFDLADWDGELVSYPHYEMYVPASRLKDLIDGKDVSEIEGGADAVIVEFSWGTTEESGYLDGHIPGAIHVNSDDIDDADNLYVLQSDENMIEEVKKQGITTASTVIVTGDLSFATHFAVVLKYLGVKNVYVLSGGTTTWTDAGYELEKTENQPTAVDDFGATEPQDPSWIDTVQEVEDKLGKDENFQLVDVRTPAEYSGKDTGYSYVEVAGRIDGAISSPTGDDSSADMSEYINVDGTMRQGDQLLAKLQEDGVDADKDMAFYCGNGYRAAQVAWDFRLLGYDNAINYNDGWCGWIVNDLPYVTD